MGGGVFCVLKQMHLVHLPSTVASVPNPCAMWGTMPLTSASASMVNAAPCAAATALSKTLAEVEREAESPPSKPENARCASSSAENVAPHAACSSAPPRARDEDTSAHTD